MENTPWVPQEDGTYLPSADLIQAVRDRPEDFPNAVEDFSVLSGKTREEIQAVLDNPARQSGFLPNLLKNSFVGQGIDFQQGLLEAGATAADKLGFDGAAEAIQDFGDSLDPSLDTEKGVAETVAEVAGQAAPAVGGALATGGIVGGAVVGAGISSLSFEDEDNLIQMADEIIEGSMPDFLVITPEDDIDTSALKGLAANLITDLALLGAGHGVAKVYRLLKGGTATADDLGRVAQESGVELRPVATPEEAHSAARVAQEAVEDVSRGAKTASKVTSEETQEIARSTAKNINEVEVRFRESGEAVPVSIPQDAVLKWHRETLGAIDQKIGRNIATEGDKARFAEYKATERQQFVQASNEVLTALTERRYNDIVKLLSDVQIGRDVHNTLFKNATLKATLSSIEDRFDDIIKAIRDNPQIKTRRAWAQMTDDLFVAKAKLASMYRETGSGLSYGMLDRQGVQLGDDFLKALKAAEEKISQEAKGQGYSLFANKSDFLEAEVTRMRDLGINPLDVLETLDDMFKEFDAIRMGAIDNLKHNRLSRLTADQRQQLEGSFIRMVHDLHSSALLGQPSTSALEIMSNTINNLLLPVTQHVIGARGISEGVKGFGRAGREYAGYASGWSRGWETFKAAYKAGKSVTDDFDILDAQHASRIDYGKMAEEGRFMRYALVRLWKFAADVSIAASESQKAWRGFGVGFADGYDIALKQGMTRPQAKQFAKEYANSLFDETGAFKNTALRLDVQRSSWQSVFDTRYQSGKVLQAIDNWRNSSNPLMSSVARSALPFFRTLVNISGDSAQYVLPPAWTVRAISRTPGMGVHFRRMSRFLDDFNGTNGIAAQQRAQGRQRLGSALIGTALAGASAGLWEITGPGGYQSWNAKLAKMETKPGSSLIIGDTAIDLTRLLPFSAPLLMAGSLRSMQREQELEMVNGEYVGDMGLTGLAAGYFPALGMLMMSLLSDAAAFRGMGDLMDDVYKSLERPDEAPTFLYRRAESYAKQFVPGLPRTVGKNLGELTGEDQELYRGTTFLEKVMSGMGFPSGYKRLDFLGRPVVDRFRGIDPLNMKKSYLKEDALVAEYAHLNEVTNLSMVIPTPDRVFDKNEWSRYGYRQGTVDWLTGKQSMNLDHMQVQDGRNAYDAYREIIYQGKATKEITNSTGKYGDRIPIGSVLVQEGENLEEALRRYTGSREYAAMTPLAREKVWKAIQGIFKKEAKEYLKEELIVPKDFLQGGMYGPLTDTDTSIEDIQKTGKQVIPDIQKTRGDPVERVFAIN